MKTAVRWFKKFCKRPDGKIRYYQVYLYPLFDRKGNINHIVEYWVDITVQKKTMERLMRSKEALKHSKEEFEKVIASIPDALYSALVNKTGKILDSYYSPVIEQITGYPPSFLTVKKYMVEHCSSGRFAHAA